MKIIKRLLFSLLLLLLLILNEDIVVLVDGIQILLWSGGTWSGQGIDDWKMPNYLGQHVIKEKCPIDCVFLSQQQQHADADAILFEAQPFASWSYTFLKQPPQFPQKEVGQYYINFGYEHEKYFPISMHPGYQKHIDINNTFRGEDQVQVTFACSWGSGENGSINNFLKDPAKFEEKKGFVGFMSTNCDSGGAIYRTSYIKEMMKYTQVDAMGECLNNKKLNKKDFPHAVFEDLGDSLRIKELVLSKYKFSLAFENNNITDYVTEKVYTSLLSGSIPIYMGSPNIDEWVPKKSIIKTDDFKSPKDLVDYILYLSKNKTAYEEYFQWKKQPLPQSFIEKYNRCIFYGSDCRLCQYIDAQKKKLNNQSGFRSLFGEPYEDSKELRVLDINKETCISVKQDLKYVPPFNEKFTLMFWLILDDIRDEKPIITMDEHGLVVSVTQIWKRYYLRFCINGKCFLTDTPIANNEWRHIAISVGPSNLNSNTQSGHGSSGGGGGGFNSFSDSEQDDISENDSFESGSTTTKTRTIKTIQPTSTETTGSTLSTIKIFVDGLLDSTTTSFLNLQLSTGDIKIGCKKIVAKLDDLSIWRTNLDEKEIGEAMFKKYRGDEPSHLLYMTFNSIQIKDYSMNSQFTTIVPLNAVTETIGHKRLVLTVGE
ncbi:hypothetical protein RB653_000110 [Dictyostelium firmibasis]|uniref:Fucosyltransferase n=1 Tax=Dictyostelium firmibasis TaxID=79012 RepID=A0AAN7TW51_9MYCE